MSFHCLLSWRVSIERSAVILMGIPLCVICCFSLAAFNIRSLCLNSISLINICLGVFSRVYLVWDSLGFLDLDGYFLLHFRKVFDYYILNYFLMPFLFVVFFWDTYDLNVGAFNIVFLFSSLLYLFPQFYLPLHLSSLLPQLFYSWFPPECF